MHVEDENPVKMSSQKPSSSFQIGDKVIRHAMVKVAN
ncbi:MAG: hypothetical protein ACLSV6_03970 [Butyricicoccus sp.]